MYFADTFHLHLFPENWTHLFINRSSWYWDNPAYNVQKSWCVTWYAETQSMIGSRWMFYARYQKVPPKYTTVIRRIKNFNNLGIPKFELVQEGIQFRGKQGNRRFLFLAAPNEGTVESTYRFRDLRVHRRKHLESYIIWFLTREQE